MAQSSYPFENVDTTETQFSQMFRTLNAGVNGTPSGTELKVTAGTGLQVAVAAGQAMVRGHYYISTASENLTIGTANGSNPRIDSIVLRLDPTVNSVILAVVAGTPASSPVAPTLTQTDAGVYEYQLATVLIPTSATSVSTITDTRSFMGDRMGIWSTYGRPTDGKFRSGYNTTLGYPEYWNGSAWTAFGIASSEVATIVAQTSRNAIINGAFDIWQRAASQTAPSFTNPASGTYTADRWYMYYDGSGASRTVSRQTFTPGTAPIPVPYYLRLDQTVAGTGGTINGMFSPHVEDVNTFAGQTVTFSFYAKAAANATFVMQIYQEFGSGGSSAVLAAYPTFNFTTSWQRFTHTFTMPSISGKTIGAGSKISFIANFPVNATGTYDMTGLQLEAGSTASPFKRNATSIQAELAACQRYLPVWEGGPIPGYAYGTNAAFYSYKFPVTARIAPTSITVVTNASAYSLNSPTTVTPSIDNSNVDGASLLASLTITAGQGSRLWNGRILFNGCEL